MQKDKIKLHKWLACILQEKGKKIEKETKKEVKYLYL